MSSQAGKPFPLRSSPIATTLAGASSVLTASASSPNIAAARIGPSGATLFVECADGSGNPSPVLGISTQTTQSLQIGGASGTFTLQFGGAATATIPRGADAAVIQAALTALPNVGAGNLVVEGYGAYYASFAGALANAPQPLIGISTTGLQATAAPTPTTAGTSPRQSLNPNTSAFTTVGPWVSKPYGNNGSHCELLAYGPNGSYGVWTATGLAPGNYKLYTTWFTDPSHATNAPYRFYDGATYRGITRIDQTKTPIIDDTTSVSQCLATVYVGSGTLQVVMSDDASGLLWADTVTVVPFDPSGTVYVDENWNDSRVTYVGSWTDLGDSTAWHGRYHESSGTATDQVRYTFDGLIPGVYKVEASWVPWTDRTTLATYTVYSGGASVGSFGVNQQVGPSDSTYTDDLTGDPVKFKTLGTVSVVTGQVQVTIGGNGSGLVVADSIRFTLQTPAGESEPVLGLSKFINQGGPPSITVNGTTTSLTTAPIWHQPTSPSDPNTIPYLVYTLPSKVNPTDTVTLTVPGGILISAAGPVGGATNLAVTNLSGGTLLPPPSAGVKTMKVGYNLHVPVDYEIIAYANLMKAAESWSGDTTKFTYDPNGYPVFGAAGETAYCTVRSPYYNYVDPRAYPSCPEGVFTLMWDSDGTGDCYLQALVGMVVTLLSSSTGQPTNNSRTYQIARDPNPATNPNNLYDAGFMCVVTSSGAGMPATNIRIYPPGISTTNPPKFHPNYLQMVQGSGILRSLVMLGANSSSLINASDYPPQTQRSYNALDNRLQTFNIVSIGPFTDTTKFLETTKVPMLVTVDRPHGLITGQPAVFNAPTTGANAGSLIVALSNGSTINFTNYFLVVLYDSAHMTPSQFAVAVGPWDGVSSVSPVYTAGGTVNVGTAAVPPEDYFEVVAACAGCDAYVNVPQAASDALVTSLATLAAQKVPTGCRIYFELANEHWNFGAGFVNYNYFQGLGQQLGGDATVGYTVRAGHVYGVAKAALTAAGRGADFRGIFGTQAAVPNVTSQIVAAAQAQSPAISIDCIAPASYMNSFPLGEPQNDAVAATLTVDQCLDLLERYMLLQVPAQLLAAHYKIASATYPQVELVTYEGAIATAFIGGSTMTRALQSQACSHHPRFGPIYTYLYQTCQDVGQASRHCHYALTHIYGDEVSTGSTLYSAYSAWNMKPGKGDGSDGQYNVLPDLVGVPPGVANLSKAVSVLANAIINWQSASGAGIPVRRKLPPERSRFLRTRPRG